MKVFALVAAAGSGVRMASGRDDKPFMDLAGRPLVAYSLAAFENSAIVDSVVLVVKENHLDHARRLVKDSGFKKVAAITAGGDTRTRSVENGLAAIDAAEGDIVLVHDGARPFLSESIIKAAALAAGKYGAAVVGVPCTATIKEVGLSGAIAGTPDRKKMWEAQTPQAFRYGILKKAYGLAGSTDATDDSALVERMGQEVRMIEGAGNNIKITCQDDIAVAGAILENLKGKTKK